MIASLAEILPSTDLWFEGLVRLLRKEKTLERQGLLSVMPG